MKHSKVFAVAAACVILSGGPCAQSLFAAIGVDGLQGAEWTGVTPKTIAAAPYGQPGVGVSYDAYSRADSDYFYALVIARPAGEGQDNWTSTIAAQLGNVVNLGFDLNPDLGNGSDVVFETENNRYTDFPPVGSFYQDYSPTNGIIQASTTVRGYSDPNPGFSVELAIPWSFFETDPDSTGNMPVLTAANPDLVFRYSQSFDGTFATQGGQFGNPRPRLGVFTDPNFSVAAVPEPFSVVIWPMIAITIGGFSWFRRYWCTKAITT
jgi:hypothetical protein